MTINCPYISLGECLFQFLQESSSVCQFLEEKQQCLSISPRKAAVFVNFSKKGSGVCQFLQEKQQCLSISRRKAAVFLGWFLGTLASW